MRYFLIFFTLAMMCRGMACGAEDKPSLKVAISSFPPFVSTEGKTPRGYAIDLWREISAELGVSSKFILLNGVSSKLAALKEGEADIAIGGITATEKREETVDFSCATFHSGLQILAVHKKESEIGAVLAALFSNTHLKVILAFLVMVVMAGHLIWFVERDKGNFSKSYPTGVFEGMYWAIVTASTVGYGDKVPGKPFGRLVAMIVIIFSLPVFGYFIAALSSVMTVQTMRSSINSVEDLPGKRVAVVRGTTSEEWSNSIKAHILRYDTGAAACTAVLTGKADAAVYDSPYLHYWSKTNGQGKTVIIGKAFEEQTIAFALPEDAPLMESINRAILKLQENGRIKALEAHWFGK